MKSKLLSALNTQWVSWWKRQSPSRQDRFALIAPIAAVGIFLLTIVSSVGYLRIEEMEREQESVQRDLEYAQQKLRLHLLEQQEQMLRKLIYLSHYPSFLLQSSLLRLLMHHKLELIYLR